MHLAELTIAYPEVTRLCGFTVNPVFVGGTYRPSGGNRLKQQAIVSAHLLVAVGTFIITFLPIARYVFRRSHANWGLGLQLLLWSVYSLGTIGLVLGSWQIFLHWQRSRLSYLFQLLGAIDRFNLLLQNLTIRTGDSTDCTLLTPVLEIVRAHLLLGVKIDRLRRTGEDPSLLMASLDRNWAQLDNLELTVMEPDYSETVEQAVAILLTVNRCVGDRSIPAKT